MKLILAAFAAFFASAACAEPVETWLPVANQFSNVAVQAEWAGADGAVQVRMGSRDLDEWAFLTLKPGERINCYKSTFKLVQPTNVRLGCEVKVTQNFPLTIPDISPNAPPKPVPMVGPLVDVGTWWAGYAGESEPAVVDTDEKPANSTTGAFRIVCDPSHLAFDDPLVYPGQPGRSHLHVFFGNTSTNAYSTDASLRSGRSTCRGGTVNRSAYWIPGMVDTGPDGKRGKIKYVSALIVYYKNGYYCLAADLKTRVDCAQYVNEIPQGLHMVAGVAMSSGPQDMVTYYCVGAPYTGSAAKTWAELSCVKEKGARADGGIYEIQMGIRFPECWDGVNLSSPDNKSHMAYASATYKTRNGCPASHPVRLQSMSEEARFTVTPGEDPRQWRLASDMYSTEIAPGYSGHADYMSDWDETVVDPATGKQRRALDVINTYCNRAQKDCHAHLLGNGQALK